MVASQDLPRLAGRFIEEDEVLHQVQEVAPVADALEQRLHVHGTRVVFGQPLPLVEVPPPAGDRADPCLLAVAEHHHRVVVEEMRDRVAVVGIVLLEGRLQVAVDVLALDEQQRQPVDEADDVGPAAVEIAAHPQLAHAEEVVVRRVDEVDHAQAALRRLAPFVAIGDLYAVAHEVVLVAVGGHDGLRDGGRGDAPHGVLIRLVRQARDIGRLQHRRPVVREIDPQASAAVGEIDVHARIIPRGRSVDWDFQAGGLVTQVGAVTRPPPGPAGCRRPPPHRGRQSPRPSTC